MTDFRDAMISWVDLKKQLTEARKDISVLNKREKELREFIKSYMSKEDIGSVNVNKNKVKFTTKNAKGSVTRTVIKEGLFSYFGGDEVRVEGAFQAILDAAPEVQRSSLSLT
jgi:hypothetical protein